MTDGMTDGIIDGMIDMLEAYIHEKQKIEQMLVVLELMICSVNGIKEIAMKNS